MTVGSAVEDVPGLMLARERPHLSPARLRKPLRNPSALENVGRGPSCTSVGPFQDLASALKRRGAKGRASIRTHWNKAKCGGLLVSLQAWALATGRRRLLV